MEPPYHSAKDAFTTGFQSYLDDITFSFQHPALWNPFIYLFLVFFITFTLEAVLPKRIDYPLTKRRGFWTDLFYVLMMDYVLELIGFYAMTCVVEYFTYKAFAHFNVHLPLVDLHALLPNVFLRFLVFFVAIDFTQWLAHLLLHRIGFLWKFHKIHHAQETLGFASTRHFHWGEYLVLKPAFWIPFALLGFHTSEYVLYYVWIAYFLTFFSHCNIKIRFGFLNYIFITPETHYWHHARNIPKRYGVNYASSLTLWDLLFGFFYNPKNKEPILGIPDNDVPENFLGQMVYPFKTLFRKEPTPQNKDADMQKAQSRQERRREERKKK